MIRNNGPVRTFLLICLPLFAPLAPAFSGAAAPAVSLPGERAPLLDREDAPVRAWMDLGTQADSWALVASCEWAAISPATLLAEDDADAGSGGSPLRAGVERRPEMPLTPSTSGEWAIESDGSRTWRLALRSDGAAAIGVNFSAIDLPIGATLSVRGANEPAWAQTYRGVGPGEAGRFNGVPVRGDAAFVEYHAPADAAEPVIEIRSVAHYYRDVLAPPESGASGGGERLLECQVDVNCRTVDATARDAVGRMLFQVGEGYYLCSGSLLADVDANTFAGWFLTANHCINTQEVASTLQVLWFYQTTVCDGSIGGGITTNGATLLANTPDADFSFLRLRDDVSGGQGMSGWTTTPPSGTVYGIHHPGGSFKRYSSGPVTTAAPICGGLPLSAFIYNDWLDGMTEGGSSGSPVFNGQWQVVGQLFGSCYFAPPDCDNPQDYNIVYGRFAFGYPMISQWLNTVTPDDEYEDNDEFGAAAAIAPGDYDLRLVDFLDFFSVTLDAPARLTVSASYAQAEVDLRLRLYTAAEQILATSNGQNGTAQVSMYLQAGTYVIRVRRTELWGGDYAMSVETEPCLGDLDGNGVIGLADLSVLLSNYGQTSGAAGEDGDLDGDGDVDLADLSSLLERFGAAC